MYETFSFHYSNIKKGGNGVLSIARNNLPKICSNIVVPKSIEFNRPTFTLIHPLAEINDSNIL